MNGKVYISRRELMAGFGAIAITTSVPTPIPRTAKTVKVVCACEHDGKQYVVFDDKPTTIFVFDDLDYFEAGREYLV